MTEIKWKKPAPPEDEAEALVEAMWPYDDRRNTYLLGRAKDCIRRLDARGWSLEPPAPTCDVEGCDSEFHNQYLVHGVLRRVCPKHWQEINK